MENLMQTARHKQLHQQTSHQKGPWNMHVITQTDSTKKGEVPKQMYEKKIIPKVKTDLS
jgi:hypothetical protein